MNKAGGFITLHRQILDWEWYRNSNTKDLFLHLLLTANFTDGKFEGRTIRRGQLVTSLTGLSVQLGLTVRQIRVSLEHLEMTGEVTSQSFNRYRVITIVKYDEYQNDDKQNDRQMTGETAGKRQADDKQMTGEMTSKCQQYNNDNNNNKVTRKQNKTPTESIDTDQALAFDSFWKEYPNRVAKQNALKAWKKLKVDPELLEKIMTGLSRWKASDEWSRDGGRYIPHPATWLNGKRWEDEVKPKADVPRQAPAPIRVMPANNFEQRDYSSVDDDLMAQLARDMAEFKRTGDV